MKANVEKIAEQVKALPTDEPEQFMSWFADIAAEYTDAWETQIAQDAQPGGRLERMIERAHRDIDEARTRPLDQFLDNT